MLIWYIGFLAAYLIFILTAVGLGMLVVNEHIAKLEREEETKKHVEELKRRRRRTQYLEESL